MSVSCYKNYSLKISAPWRYYRMEEAGTADRVDDVVGNHLKTLNNGGSVTSGAGIQGNAARIGWDNPTAERVYCSATPIGQANSSFSLAFWLYVVSEGVPSGGFVSTGSFSATMFGGGLPYLSLALIVNGVTFPAPPSAVWGLFYYDAVGNNNYGGSGYGVTVPVGAWLFVHLFYNATTKEAGYSFDNGAETIFGTGLETGAGFNTYLLDFSVIKTIASTTADVLVDEVLLITGQTLTAAQVAYLYNSGAGRTWPIVLP